jgi:hypothetical protein
MFQQRYYLHLEFLRWNTAWSTDVSEKYAVSLFRGAELCKQVDISNWEKVKDRSPLGAIWKDVEETSPFNGYVLYIVTGRKWYFEKDHRFSYSWRQLDNTGGGVGRRSNTMLSLIITWTRSESLDLQPSVNALRVLCILQSLFLYIILDSHCDTQSAKFHVFVLIDDY